MAEMAEATEDVPFSVENARKEDCLEYEEYLNFKEAYLKLHIKNINKFLPGRKETLNYRIAAWKDISDNNSVEKERRFEKIKQAQIIVQHLRDEKTRLRKDLKETKLQKQIFLDSGKTSQLLKYSIFHYRFSRRCERWAFCMGLRLTIVPLIILQRGIYRGQEHVIHSEMFKKPFKIKSNVQMKGSERRTFKSLLTKSFPKISENEADELLEKKNIIGVVKIVTHDQESLQVYTAQKRPMFFEIRGKIFPTIYFLWKYPELIYAFTTHKQVMSHISNGADLMLPGVLTPPAQSGLPKYGNLNEADVASVNLSHNKAPIAVGIAAQNSASMLLSNGRGKCVNILHYWGDKLCLLDGNILPVPNMPPPDWLKLNNYDDDFPQLGTVQSKSPTNVDITKELDEDVTITEETEPNQADSTTETPVPMTVEEMDELLNYCFLGAIKYSKTLELPALTSNFFKIHMLPICPVDKTLDIKKTSYKKLKPFLEKMCEIGLISKMEIKKGVEAIIRINKEHEKFSEFYINPDERPKIKVSESDTSPAASISEQFKITKVVMPIFENQGYQKNDTVGVANIRKCVTNYVKDHNCQHADNPRLCQPDKALEEICKTRSPITWEELMESVLNAMKDCHIVTCGGDTIISNGKISPITLTVAVRSGNKKVTLIDNLDSFGIYIPDFAKELQHGVAASTTISKHPAKKTDQLLVQGNQVSFIYNLLVDKYKVSKQYIKGLENAPKKKKQ